MISNARSSFLMSEEKFPKTQQVLFRLDETTFIEFKKKLLDDGNISVQKFCESMVKQYLEG